MYSNEVCFVCAEQKLEMFPPYTKDVTTVLIDIFSTVITRPTSALDRRMILWLDVPGFQRQAFKQVEIFSERSKKLEEQITNKGSVFVKFVSQ